MSYDLKHISSESSHSEEMISHTKSLVAKLEEYIKNHDSDEAKDILKQTRAILNFSDDHGGELPEHIELQLNNLYKAFEQLEQN